MNKQTRNKAYPKELREQVVKLVQAGGQTVSEIAREFKVAFKLRREQTTKAPALKVAIKAEREIFRLKRELQRLDIEDLEQAKGRTSLPEVRRGGKAVDLYQLLRRKVRNDEP